VSSETQQTRPAAPSPLAATAAQAPRRLGLVLAVIATAQLMVALGLTIVNVALPHIQAALGFSGSNLEWVANGYAVAFGGLLLLGGRAGDLLGAAGSSLPGCWSSFWPRCSAGWPPTRRG
jgi:MFS family permease